MYNSREARIFELFKWASMKNAESTQWQQLGYMARCRTGRSENCALPATPSAFAVDRVATHGSVVAIPARVEEH